MITIEAALDLVRQHLPPRRTTLLDMSSAP